MRLLTWNVWKNSPPYETRVRIIAAEIAAADPDIVLLQEAFVGGGADTARDLGRALGLVATAAPARLKRRPHGGAMVDSTNGLAILSRRPVDFNRVVALPAHPDDPDRIAQIVRVGALVVVNVHLTHLAGADALRRGQIVHLLDRLPEDKPTVVAGDLNAEPEGWAPRTLREAGFHDLAEAAPCPTCGGRRIDFLLCRGLPVQGATVRAVGDRPIHGIDGSDHVGVLAELPDPDPR